MRNAQIDEMLHRLLAPFQGRGIYLIERDAFVGVVKHCSLIPSKIVQISVHATALDNIPEVKIRLAVTNEIDFFTDQFLHYFGASGGRAQK